MCTACAGTPIRDAGGELVGTYSNEDIVTSLTAPRNLSCTSLSLSPITQQRWRLEIARARRCSHTPFLLPLNAVSFSRAWTGFDFQARRSNVEACDRFQKQTGGVHMNLIDPMLIRPEW